MHVWEGTNTGRARNKETWDIRAEREYVRYINLLISKVELLRFQTISLEFPPTGRSAEDRPDDGVLRTTLLPTQPWHIHERWHVLRSKLRYHNAEHILTQSQCERQASAWTVCCHEPGYQQWRWFTAGIALGEFLLCYKGYAYQTNLRLQIKWGRFCRKYQKGQNEVIFHDDDQSSPIMPEVFSFFIALIKNISFLTIVAF